MEQAANRAVQTSTHDGVLTITLNRPEKRNAVNREVAEQISVALDRLDSDPELHVGVLTGAGNSFCAGLDLDAFSRGEIARSPDRGFAGIVEKPSVKPMVAAVEGWALGGGFEIVLSCDLLVAAKTARFGLPEVKRGLVARGGGALRLAQHIPRAHAMQLLFTGESISAGSAYSYGMVNRITEEGGALAGALELARAIAANAPLAVAASKRIALESDSWPQEDAFARQNEILQPVFDSDDAREGSLAFRGRRAPRWNGR